MDKDSTYAKPTTETVQKGNRKWDFASGLSTLGSFATVSEKAALGRTLEDVGNTWGQPQGGPSVRSAGQGAALGRGAAEELAFLPHVRFSVPSPRPPVFTAQVPGGPG